MCGRYGLPHLTWARIAELSGLGFDRAAQPELVSRYNIAPTQPAPIVRRVEGGLEGAVARWDLVPRWWTKPLEEKRYATFNARVEEVAKKPMFKDAARRRRCLVPASYFVEWRAEPGGKQPYRIARADAGLMMLAGLWDSWAGIRKGESVSFDSFTVLVGEPNPLVARLHDRMPVILHPEDYRTWLDGTLEEALAVAGVFPSQLLRAVPISREINSSRAEGPDRDDLIVAQGAPLVLEPDAGNGPASPGAGGQDEPPMSSR